MTETSTAPGRPMVGKIQSDDDHANLLSYHLAEIKNAQAAVERAKEPVTEAKAVLSDKNEVLTKAYNTAKGDLGRGYTREYLGSLVADGRKKISAQVDFEEMRARDKVALNQPVYGVQPELFPGNETPQAAKDEMAWEAEGVLRGMRGDMDELHPGDPPSYHQAIMKGFRDGQEVAQQRYLRGQELRKAAETPDPAAKIVDLAKTEPTEKQKAAAIRASEKLARESLGAPAPKAGGKGPPLKAVGDQTTTVRAEGVH